MSFEKEGIITSLICSLILMGAILVINSRQQSLNEKISFLEARVVEIATMVDV